MLTTTRRAIGVAGLAVLMTATAVWAQQKGPPPVRVRGEITKVDGLTLTVKSRTGETLTVKLAEPPRIAAMVKASLDDIKEGSFIGVSAMPEPDGTQKAYAIHIFMDSQKGVVPAAAMPQPDGSQKALEVHIFPEEMRGTGDGHRPYAPVANSTMTNGTADAAVVTGVDGPVMVVKYKGGEKKIIIPPGIPIVRYEIGGPADLKPGAHFTVLSAVKKPDGSFEANRINVGRDGVVPQ